MWKVTRYKKSWWIESNKNTFLWHDGTVNEYTYGHNEPHKRWIPEYDDYVGPDWPKRFEQGFFKTKEEAEQFLAEFLRGDTMNERLAQVEKDIKLLKEERDRLTKRYRCGQRFMVDGTECLLIQTDDYMGQMIAIYNGNRYNGPVRMEKGDRGVTAEEIDKMCSYNKWELIEE